MLITALTLLTNFAVVAHTFTLMKDSLATVCWVRQPRAVSEENLGDNEIKTMPFGATVQSFGCRGH